MSTKITGYPTRSAAAAAVTTSGYRVEIVDLSDRGRGTGYAALSRGSYSPESPIGTYDARLDMPSGAVDSVAEIARMLGAEVM